MNDIEASYRRALIEEYEGYRRAGQDDRAKGVAAVLRDQYGYEVDRERADEKAPENAAEPKPTQRRPAAKTKSTQKDQA